MAENLLAKIIAEEGINIEDITNASHLSTKTIKRLLESSEVTSNLSSQTRSKILSALNRLGRKKYHVDDVFPDTFTAKDKKQWATLRAERLSGPHIVGKIELPIYKANLFRHEQIQLIIDQGTAPDHLIADLLADISVLYRMQGGSGINFEVEGIISFQS